MAVNLLNGDTAESCCKGAEVEALLERNGLKLHGFGMPTWSAFPKSLRLFTSGRVEHHHSGSIGELEAAISAQKIPIVAVAWQSTKEILSHVRNATVGHYMVVVGFDCVTSNLFFLNPALNQMEGSSHLYRMAYEEFEIYWNRKRNFFIQPGCIWTLSA